MAAGGHFGCSKLIFDGISGHFKSIRNFFLKLFLQNGRRRPFWPSEIRFRSHFWSFQINTDFFKIFDKMAAAAIVDVRKSPSITFLAISDQ